MIIYTRKIKLNPHPSLKLFLLSDLHFRGPADVKKFQQLATHAKKCHPDAIILAGDIIDTLQVLDNSRSALKAALSAFSEVAPTYAGFGNHDISEYRIINNDFFQISNSQKFKEYLALLSEIDDFTPLHNCSAKIKNKTIYGLTLPSEYYNTNVPCSPLVEHPQILEAKMKTLPPADLTLIHSPAYIKNPHRLIISGHMHGGILPLGLGIILPGTRGLISPEKKFFPENTRKGVGPHIILGPVTTFPEKLRHLNFLFPVESAIIEL